MAIVDLDFKAWVESMRVEFPQAFHDATSPRQSEFRMFIAQRAFEAGKKAGRRPTPEPQAEAVAWYSPKVDDCITADRKRCRERDIPHEAYHYTVPLYTRPQPGDPTFVCDFCGSDYTRTKFCCKSRREYMNAHGHYERPQPGDGGGDPESSSKT